MTRARTPPNPVPRLNTPSIYPACAAPNCETAARHGPLCYHHTHQSRQRLAGEHRRLQRHHGALLAAAVELVDRLRRGDVDINVARAVKHLERHLGPPTRP